MICEDRYRFRYVALSEADREFISLGGAEKCVGFLTELRAKRLGETLHSFSMLPTYVQEREIADEAAIVNLPGMEFVAPARPDAALLDAIAKRERQERSQAFEAFLATRSDEVANPPRKIRKRSVRTSI